MFGWLGAIGVGLKLGQNQQKKVIKNREIEREREREINLYNIHWQLTEKSRKENETNIR